MSSTVGLTASPAYVASIVRAREEAVQEVEIKEAEISRLTAELVTLRGDFKIACESRDSEARLACDLRVSQDTVIERCAQAVAEKWPEAAALLRSHADGISGEDWGELRRENERLKAEIGERSRPGAQCQVTTERCGNPLPCSEHDGGGR